MSQSAKLKLEMRDSFISGEKLINPRNSNYEFKEY